MGDIKITIKALKPRKVRTSGYNRHFRLEKRPGAIKGGVALPAKGAKFLGAYSGSWERLGFERRGHLYFPNNNAPKGQVLTRLSVAIRKNNSCAPELVPFNQMFFGGLKVVETRVGVFDNDSSLDVAYIVRDAKGKLFSYVLLQNPRTFCVHTLLGPQATWHSMEPLIHAYLDLFGKIPRSTMKKFAALHKFHVDVKRMRQYMGLKTMRWIKNLIKNWRHYVFTEKELAIVIDKLLNSIVKGRWQTTDFFYTLANATGYKQQLAIPLVKALEKIDRKLSAEQFSLLAFAFMYGKSRNRPNKTVREIIRISESYSGEKLYKRLYKLVNGFKGITSNVLLKYQEMLKFIPDLKARDILAAERTIGARAALRVWKSFRVHRFDRYHPSILKHLVKMADNPNHDRHKPLIIAVTATDDHSDMFYWGRKFKYDPRIRLVVVEVPDNYYIYKRVMWDLRKKYGIPDTVLFTAHGEKKAMIVGGISLNKIRMIERDFKGYFGDKEGFVVINACSAGARPKKGKLNLAQMIANAMGAETLAARAVEGLLSIKVYIDKEGRARLRPVYFEVGWPHFGFNVGGSRFYPNQTDTVPESVYNSAADINTGWKPGAGMSIVGRDPVLSLMFGGRYAFAHRVRLGLDVAMHYNPLRQSISYTLDPEVFVGLTNHFGFFGGGRFGVTTRMDGQVSPLYQANFGAKIMLPFMNGELDIGGTSINGEKPKFFFKFQGRF